SYWLVGGVRRWVDGLPLQALILLHVSRFVGIYFLILHQRGQLPWAFAIPGGWGDILIAASAVLIAGVSANTPTGRRVLLAWNTLGLRDILGVVVPAARLALAEPASMLALTILPLGLLPTFFVPLIIATHVVIFRRLMMVRTAATA